MPARPEVWETIMRTVLLAAILTVIFAYPVLAGPCSAPAEPKTSSIGSPASPA